ncbi:MAG: 4-hydroxythreonine-4-phosphate dehydrogenase PdxA [Verrucomicrobiota bacterium]
MNPPRPVIGITLGDAAGIGPEVTRGALAGGRLDPRFDYRIIGACPGAVPGRPDAVTARAALDSLEESVRLLKTGEIAAVVTAPVSKDLLAAQGFTFPGQTEFYAERFDAPDFQMCLTGPRLTVGLVTIHEPLRRVPDLLSTPEVVRHGRLLAEFCRSRGRKIPRIAVAGLNPHAGENGRMGMEEITVIIPAVAELNAAESVPVFHGPLPPDTLFQKAARGGFDAVLCMYHDQGLIPLKLLDFDEAVNLTLGLPIIRTSPDHGTAFDIAGKNTASPASMTAALRLAAELAASRQTGE